MDTNKDFKLILSDMTMKQLVIAFGIARKLDINEICRIASCSRNYYYKVIKTVVFFNDVVTLFIGLPKDKDTENYKGLGTAMMEIARLLFSIGEK